jgi:hypothetical protein
MDSIQFSLQGFTKTEVREGRRANNKTKVNFSNVNTYDVTDMEHVCSQFN